MCRKCNRLVQFLSLRDDKQHWCSSILTLIRRGNFDTAQALEGSKLPIGVRDVV